MPQLVWLPRPLAYCGRVWRQQYQRVVPVEFEIRTRHTYFQYGGAMLANSCLYIACGEDRLATGVTFALDVSVSQLLYSVFNHSACLCHHKRFICAYEYSWLIERFCNLRNPATGTTLWYCWRQTLPQYAKGRGSQTISQHRLSELYRKSSVVS